MVTNTLSRSDYDKTLDLFIEQEWISESPKSDSFYELLGFCDSKAHKDLIFSLLHEFKYLSLDEYGQLLNKIAGFIVENSGFSCEETQVVSLTADWEADSGQKLLYEITPLLSSKGWSSITSVNLFTKVEKYYNKGKKKIVLIDEFIGSGKTLRTRLKNLRSNFPSDIEIKVCFLAGIESTINTFKGDGIEIFCSLPLNKGISERFGLEDVFEAKNSMQELESKLAEKINDKKLTDYSFGYGMAEALYSLERCNGNTPNSVFPIFWWILDRNNKERNTLLRRYEKGF